MDVLHVALMPPRRRASFLLGGGAVSVSMLRGDSETECLLEDVVDDSLMMMNPSSWRRDLWVSSTCLLHSSLH
jgi:hypothetical protein